MPVDPTAKMAVLPQQVRSRRSSAMKNRIHLVPAMCLVAGILISYPAFSFAQSRAVRLNENALAYAQELIAQARVVVDKKNAWRDHHPRAEEENEFIRAHGFAEYDKWHLGIDQTHGEGTKARYKFPFGDFKNIHRCALLAVRSRAHQYGYSDIENAAMRLLQSIDSKKESENRKRRGIFGVSERFSLFHLCQPEVAKSQLLKNASINSGRSLL
jgi:hypothetical protein